jgi:glycerol-3-phosphate acyltransferase PlsY
VAILGHIFPLFAGFRGGKGVATMTGTLLALNPVAAVIAIIFFMWFFRLQSTFHSAAWQQLLCFLLFLVRGLVQALRLVVFFCSCCIIITYPPKKY